MLYLWLYPLHTEFSFLNVFRYLSFRIIYAAVTAFLLAFVLTPMLIRKLQEMGLGQQVRDDGPSRHLAKTGTPTMGGLLILFAVLLSTMLWADVTNRYVWLAILATIGFGLVGFVDDYLKVARNQPKGLSASQKILAQGLVALGIGLFFYFLPGYSTKLSVPFFKNFTPDLFESSLGLLWFIPYPASVFMGDVGSLPLGAALGTVAVVSKHELLLLLVGGVFVIEAISVIFQVASYISRGKRIFLMVPIHHHFEMKGWEEPKVVVRLWIIAILLALLSLSTLKLR